MGQSQIYFGSFNQYFKSIAGVVPQETLGDLAAGRIAGTQKENALLT